MIVMIAVCMFVIFADLKVTCPNALSKIKE